VAAVQYELAIVVSTLNERANLAELVSRVDARLKQVGWELIFVDDDSSDGTSQVAWQLSERWPNIRCIRCVGCRGLSSACVKGMLSSSARYYAVMDADLQHDEALLPRHVGTPAVFRYRHRRSESLQG
jgi:dolichol-phosphate mannosyltransferase